VWHLPGPGRWLENLTGIVERGRPAIAACPSSRRPRGLPEAAIEVASRRLRVAAERVPAELPARTHPALVPATVADRLGLARPTGVGFTAEHLAAHPGTTDRLLLVDARSQPPEVQAAWTDFAVAVGTAGQAVPVIDRPGLIVAVAPTSEQALPRPAPTHSVVWWWGVLGPLDLLVHLHDAGLGPVASAEIAEMARWDLDLADRLARGEVAAGNGPSCTGELAVPAVPTEIHVACHGRKAGERPGRHLAGWRLELVESWDGRVDHHSTISADLPRRRWLAQVGTLFPWLELVRAELGHRSVLAAGHHGIDPSGLRDLELSLLKGRLHELGVRLAQADYDLLRKAVQARHAIAHLVPVPPEELVSLARAAERANLAFRL
jgi:hypothetical protein